MGILNSESRHHHPLPRMFAIRILHSEFYRNIRKIEFLRPTNSRSRMSDGSRGEETNKHGSVNTAKARRFYSSVFAYCALWPNGFGSYTEAAKV